MLRTHIFLCLFPRLCPITPNHLSVFTGCLEETSSNIDSGELSLLLYHPALCAGKCTTQVNGTGQGTLDNLSSLAKVDLQGAAGVQGRAPGWKPGGLGPRPCSATGDP